MIGVDIVVVSRIEAAMKRHGERFLQRFLNEEEIALAQKTETAAGFWAAKEAVAKALGCGIGAELGFHDILLVKSPKGAPSFTLPPAIMQRYAITDTSLSIAHDGGFAIAVAAIETAASPASDEV
ncbi:holo-ACP synthase [Hydrogenimonas sp.]